MGLVEDWRKALNRKEKVYLLALDMSKAFDSLHHSLTLANSMRMVSATVLWISVMRSFFYGRLKRVKVSTAKSNWKEMKRGYPQGS